MKRFIKTMIAMIAILMTLGIICGGYADEMASGNDEMTSSEMAMEKININIASLDELCKLDRVGPKYAQRIIDHRDKYGPFKSPEEIMNVRGIGRKTFESNKDVIVVKMDEKEK